MTFSYKGMFKILKLKLQKDLSRDIKRGHPWVYKNALDQELPSASGFAQLFDKKGRFLASGIFEANSPLSFRVLSTEEKKIDIQWISKKLNEVIQRRRIFFDASTTGYRLINGEGDGLPGLICDIYGDVAVLQTDGINLDSVWDLKSISETVCDRLKIPQCVHKPQRGKGVARVLKGENIEKTPQFLENNMKFTADVFEGQKTGFFLDQRNNRSLVRHFSKGKDVLNLFSYTGGFSIAAGMGGASSVCSVDVSSQAIEVAQEHWQRNDLQQGMHRGVAQDVFKFCEADNKLYDMVIADPPSFAPNKSSVDKATQSYVHIFSESARKVKADGLLALASCSSHINFEMFDDIVVQALSKARRRGRVLNIQGQPEDHPYPLVCTELRYLKFYLLQLF